MLKLKLLEILEAKEEFIAIVSRGGLLKPSNYLYIAAVNATVLYSYIKNDDDLMKSLLATENPRDTFMDCFLKLTNTDELSAELLKVECAQKHSHRKHLQRTAFTIFNISAKNYANQRNNELRAQKTAKENAKREKQPRKTTKLQSGRM